ncbi:transposable element Tcb1 transposase [Trichonephila clavipes]|nr:transposable element Tcb1 transposase [Trichonephila clavipes]
MLNMLRHTGPASGIMVLGGIGYHSRTPLIRIADTLNSQRYISEMLGPLLSFFIFRAWPQRYFNRIMPDHTRHALSKGSSSIIRLNCSLAGSLSGSFADRNMWSMVAQRLTQITPLAATPDQLWKRVEASWSAVPQ